MTVSGISGRTLRLGEIEADGDCTVTVDGMPVAGVEVTSLGVDLTLHGPGEWRCVDCHTSLDSDEAFADLGDGPRRA